MAVMTFLAGQSMKNAVMSLVVIGVGGAAEGAR